MLHIRLFRLNAWSLSWFSHYEVTVPFSVGASTLGLQVARGSAVLIGFQHHDLNSHSSEYNLESRVQRHRIVPSVHSTIRIGLVARICRSHSSKEDQYRQGRGSIPRFGLFSSFAVMLQHPFGLAVPYEVGGSLDLPFGACGDRTGRRMVWSLVTTLFIVRRLVC
jgi:hypothetical protein